MILEFSTNGIMPIVIIILAIVVTLIGLLTGTPARIFYKKLALKRSLKKITSYFISDLDLNHLGDFIVVSKYGVNLIKIINTPGEFYGNDSKPNWTLINKKTKRTVKNPVKMLNEGAKIIKEKYDIDVTCYMIFNFGNISGIESKTLTTNKELLNRIQSQKEIFSKEDIINSYNKLLDLKIKKNK